MITQADTPAKTWCDAELVCTTYQQNISCVFLKNYVPISHDQQNFNILSNSEVTCNVSLNSKLSLGMAKTYIPEIPGKLKAP